MKDIVKTILVLVSLTTLLYAQPPAVDKQTKGDPINGKPVYTQVQSYADPRAGVGGEIYSQPQAIMYAGQNDSIISVASVTKVNPLPFLQESDYEIKDKSIVPDELPFKNNHERNLLYAFGLYEAGEREEALDALYDMIAAYHNIGDRAREAEVHEKFAYLYYEQDKQWQAETRDVEDQISWQRTRNLKAVEELTEFLHCYYDSDLIAVSRRNERFDKNFVQIIKCLEENKAWAMALDWIDKYELFRNPQAAEYNDRIDFIQFKKAEYYYGLKSYQKALTYYRQVAFGFGQSENSKYRDQALEKYNDLLKLLKPAMFNHYKNIAKIRESSGDWEGAFSAIEYSRRYALNSEIYDRFVSEYKQRRDDLFARSKDVADAALDKQRWAKAKSALSDCLNIACDNPELFATYKACSLAERAEHAAKQDQYVQATELFAEAVSLAHNKLPFQTRYEAYESQVSGSLEVRLDLARELIVRNDTIAAAIIIQSVLDIRPKHKGAETLLEDIQDLAVSLGDNTELKLTYVPAGEFVMGSPDSEIGRESNEGPVRKVSISSPFYMGIYEVTQEQYNAVMGNNPSKFKGRNMPVEQVSWNDAMEFCAKLSEITKMNISLPTEAQWEYACRAGSQTSFSFGDNINNLAEYAWYSANSGNRTNPVGQKKPNKFGLYDMHGNVWEWCLDWYRDGYSNKSSNDPSGPARGSRRVIRGGSWYDNPPRFRSAYRHSFKPESSSTGLGFRVVVLPML